MYISKLSLNTGEVFSFWGCSVAMAEGSFCKHSKRCNIFCTHFNVMAANYLTFRLTEVQLFRANFLTASLAGRA